MFTSTRRLAVALSGSVLLMGGSARAQNEAPPMFNPPPPDLPSPYVSGSRSHMANTGLQVGIRTGYGGGSGDVYRGLGVRDASTGGIPIIVDLGYRALPELYAGIYGGFAPIFTKNNPVSCPGDLDCKTDQWRFGVQFDFHYIPSSRFDPYIGLGGGYEILHTNVSGGIAVPTPLGSFPGNVNATITDRGWEFANLTFGFDARFSRAVALGPFISGSLSEYGVHSGTQVVTVAGNQVAATPVPNVNHGLHELYFAGLRGTFNP
jgi:hypothetical protein